MRAGDRDLITSSTQGCSGSQHTMSGLKANLNHRTSPVSDDGEAFLSGWRKSGRGPTAGLFV